MNFSKVEHSVKKLGKERHWFMSE